VTRLKNSYVNYSSIELDCEYEGHRISISIQVSADNIEAFDNDYDKLWEIIAVKAQGIMHLIKSGDYQTRDIERFQGLN